MWQNLEQETLMLIFYLQADKILEQLQAFIHAYDLNGLRDYWAYLDSRIFCRLEQVSLCCKMASIVGFF